MLLWDTDWEKPPLKGVTPHGVGRCPQGRGDRSVRGEPPLGGGGVLSWNLLHDVIDLGVTPQSVLRTASFPFRGAYVQITSPERGGGPAKLVEGFCGIFYVMCKIYEVTPQSPAVPAQHKARPSGALKGSQFTTSQHPQIQNKGDLPCLFFVFMWRKSRNSR